MVLVVIGFIVGGVLVGRDMIKAAEVRATITQIEKFNTAANTFKEKYGNLPGDITASQATLFGFGPRGQYAGEGDGNGVIEGVSNNIAYNNWGFYSGAGETAMFWVDLSKARLISDSFSSASSTATASYDMYVGGGLQNYLPSAKLNANLFISVWSQNGTNYYALSQVYAIYMQSGCISCVGSSLGVTVQQAYAIDKKIDDGFPQSGSVTAQYNNYGQAWAGASGTNATAGSSTTCYDNNATSGGQQVYSTEISNGNGLNCALSFRFQ